MLLSLGNGQLTYPVKPGGMADLYRAGTPEVLVSPPWWTREGGRTTPVSMTLSCMSLNARRSFSSLTTCLSAPYEG